MHASGSLMLQFLTITLLVGCGSGVDPTRSQAERPEVSTPRLNASMMSGDPCPSVNGYTFHRNCWSTGQTIQLKAPAENENSVEATNPTSGAVAREVVPPRRWRTARRPAAACSRRSSQAILNRRNGARLQRRGRAPAAATRFRAVDRPRSCRPAGSGRSSARCSPAPFAGR